jgi:RNA polymerase sigma-70 factor (ECF subfamily)
MNFEPGTPDDETLVARAQNGDTGAFAVIYDRHVAGVVRALATFAGPDSDQLDDLAQDVFFRVISHVDSYRPVRPFAHWLYTIALNVGRNHVRDRAKVVRLEDSAGDTRFEGTYEQPEDVLADTLMRLVSRLPGKLQDVVSLRIGGDLSYREIAGMLDIPEGTARRRMFTATRMLREEAGMAEPERRQTDGKQERR